MSVVALTAALGVQAPREALAVPLEAEAEGWREPESTATSPATSETSPSYGTALTLAYVLAPLLAIPVGAGLSELTGNDGVAVAGGALALVAVPVATHALHGESARAAVSALMLPAVAGAGVLVGGGIGYAVGVSGCEDSDCELADGIGGIVLGALVGGLAGYVGYAIYDVAANSSPEEERREGGAGLAAAPVRLWASPVMAKASPRAPREQLDGAVFGAAITF